MQSVTEIGLLEAVFGHLLCFTLESVPVVVNLHCCWSRFSKLVVQSLINGSISFQVSAACK